MTLRSLSKMPSVPDEDEAADTLCPEEGGGTENWKLIINLVIWYFNGWQLAKMKKSIPDMSLPWNL